MNHDKENKASNRTLAVGWFDNAPFRAICEKYVPRIKEVFFAWPGVTASRPMAEWTPERKQLFFTCEFGVAACLWEIQCRKYLIEMCINWLYCEKMRVIAQNSMLDIRYFFVIRDNLSHI